MKALVRCLGVSYEDVIQLRHLCRGARDQVTPQQVQHSIIGAACLVTNNFDAYVETLPEASKEQRRARYYRNQWKSLENVRLSCVAWGIKDSTPKEVIMAVLGKAATFHNNWS